MGPYMSKATPHVARWRRLKVSVRVHTRPPAFLCENVLLWIVRVLATDTAIPRGDNGKP